MALWKVNGEVVFAPGALSLPGSFSPAFVSRFSYKVPYSNVGKGGFIEKDGKKFHTPSWIEPKVWEFKSESSDKEYKVKMNASGNLSCSCWGYIAHRKCKHIKKVKDDGIF